MPVCRLEKYGPNHTVALDISKPFETIWLVAFLYKFKSYGNFRQAFIPIFSCPSNGMLHATSVQECHNNVGVRGYTRLYFLFLLFSCYILMLFLTMLSIILLSALIIILPFTLNVRFLILDNSLNWVLKLV